MLELNASDARGIDVVRNKIKMFAQKKVALPPGRHKIIILDEADSMTAAAQQALRRTMEVYSATTRFALACNNSTKIIEPIQSRCAVLRFTRLLDAELLARLQQVCAAESVAYDSSGLEAIIFTAEGDMRNALNALQSTVSGFSFVTSDNVFKVCDQPHPLKIRSALDQTRKGKMQGAQVCISLPSSTNNLYFLNNVLTPSYLPFNAGLQSQDIIMGLWSSGYAATDIITTLFRVCRSSDLPEQLKLEYIREIGFTHMRIAEGLNTQLQLLGCVARLCSISKK